MNEPFAITEKISVIKPPGRRCTCQRKAAASLLAVTDSRDEAVVAEVPTAGPKLRRAASAGPSLAPAWHPVALGSGLAADLTRPGWSPRQIAWPATAFCAPRRGGLFLHSFRVTIPPRGCRLSGRNFASNWLLNDHKLWTNKRFQPAIRVKWPVPSEYVYTWEWTTCAKSAEYGRHWATEAVTGTEKKVLLCQQNHLLK